MHAINAAVMRRINRKLILNEIRIRPISRAEIAEITKLTRASVTQIIEELIAEGIVIETKVVGRMRLGRRSTQLEIAADAGVMFGADIGPKQCAVGAVDMRGRVLTRAEEPVSGLDPEQVYARVAGIILQQMAELGVETGRCHGIGVSLHGPAAAGTVHDDGAAELERRTGLKVFLESAVNARALDEKYYGGQEESFLLISVGEDLQASVITGGHVYHGAAGRSVDAGGLGVSVSTLGDLRQALRPEALLEGLPFGSWLEVSGHRGEPAAEEAVSRLAGRLAFGAADLLSAFGLERMVLAGNPEYLSGDISGRVREETGRRVSGGPVTVTLSGEKDPVRVAAAVVCQDFFYPEVCA